MAEKYYVFRLPRLYHQDIAVINETKFLSEDISDGICEAERGVHHVSVEIGEFEKGERDITVNSYSGNHNETAVLKYISSSCNGLIQYYYKADSRYKETRFIFEAVPGPVYHMMKGFFHRHEYHVSNADYTLTAFPSDHEINLKEVDNEALVFYLEQFEKKFRGYRDLAFEKLDFIKRKDCENLDELLYNYTTRHKDLDHFCNNALGEFLYYDSLFHSWYNESCKHNYSHRKNEAANDLCKELHRSALNTQNAIGSIRQIRQENKNLYDFKEGEYLFSDLAELQERQDTTQKLIKNGEKVAKISKILAWMSVLLGILSLFLGLWSVMLALG